jgi:hypothetical protein
MAAPKGNKNAIGNKGGAPTKYKPEYCEDLIKFFDVPPKKKELMAISRGYDKKTGEETFKKEEWKMIPNELPTIYKFCKKIGIGTTTFESWTNTHVEFQVAYIQAKDLYKSFLIANGLENLYNGAFAIFVAKNTTDMRDKQEIEHSGSVSLGALFEETKV